MRALLCLALWTAEPAWAGLLAADHRGTFTGTSVEWESSFVQGRAEPVPLLTPLPAEAVVLSGAEATYDEQGRIVALTPHGWTVRLRQPAAEGPLQLAAPLARADVVQRVTLTGASFQPDDGLALRRHLDSRRHRTVDRRARRAADRRLGGRPPPGEQPIYVVADPPLEVAGLSGQLVGEPRRVGVAGVLLLVFALGLAGLWGVYRALARAADGERRRAGR